MAPIKSIIFYLSGIVVPPLKDCVAASMPGYSKIDFSKKRALLKSTADLSMGKALLKDYLHEVISIGDLTLDAEKLEKEVLGHIKVNHDVLEVIAETEKLFKPVFICDYPSAWSQYLAEKLPSNKQIIGNTIFTDQMDLKDLELDLLEKTIKPLGYSPEYCLWFDAYEKRAMDALTYGAHAVIFVDARRLRREFVLREILPPLDHE